MTSATPVVDPLLWGRFLLGAALVLWLPGHVWFTRHWRRTSWPVRIAGAMAAGLLLAPALSRALAALGAPVQPWVYVPTAVALGFALGRIGSFGEFLRELDLQARGRWSGVAAGACAVGAFTFVVGFASFTAPPHVHDASNHAFLTSRIVQAGSIEAATSFADGYGQPGLPYLVGMHVSAALVARAGGLAPYVSVWFLTAMASILLPLSLVILWRLWALPGLGLGAAALVVAASRFAPAGVLTWGGFGVVVGMSLVPLVVLLATRAWTSRSPWPAALAGSALGTLVHVHASQAAVALLLAVLTWILHPVRPRCTWRGGVLLAAGLLLALGPTTMSDTARAYLEAGMASFPQTRTAAGTLIERYLKSGGTSPHLVGWWMISLGLALGRPRWRRLAGTSLALGGLAFALGALGDPISRSLASPFYREPWRVQYVQLFFAPALMGMAAAWAWDRLGQRAGRRASAALATVLALAIVLVPQPSIVRLYRDTTPVVPFTRADYAHAVDMREVVEAGAWVANDPDDGSTWAMHVSGRRFLRPTSWDLRDARGTWVGAQVGSLADDPWPDTTRALQRRQVRYVYASDTRIGDGRLTRSRLDADPRFEPALVGETSTLYRILW